MFFSYRCHGDAVRIVADAVRIVAEGNELEKLGPEGNELFFVLFRTAESAAPTR
jgi:hypothetical protein